MLQSPSELAAKYRERADHYRELASITRNAEMRMTFLHAVAAYERAAAIADFEAAEEGKRSGRR
jgi:hypothetical protein